MPATGKSSGCYSLHNRKIKRVSPVKEAVWTAAFFIIMGLDYLVEKRGRQCGLGNQSLRAGIEARAF